MIDISNWKTQIRKGYLELCLLMLIEHHGRLYGLELLEKLLEGGLEIKEGTLYPLMNRMTVDGLLESVWVTENIKGHPRKFYSLTPIGKKNLDEMKEEFKRLVNLFDSIQL
jgi:PadR family transcriptional regulator PadR